MRRLASLESVVEAETAFGGRTRSWSEVASLWVELSVTGAREDSQADQRPDIAEAAKAVARDLAAAQAGQRLVVGGDNWRLVRVVRGAPRIGRMTLFLQKDPS